MNNGLVSRSRMIDGEAARILVSTALTNRACIILYASPRWQTIIKSYTGGATHSIILYSRTTRTLTCMQIYSLRHEANFISFFFSFSRFSAPLCTHMSVPYSNADLSSLSRVSKFDPKAPTNQSLPAPRPLHDSTRSLISPDEYNLSR